MDLRKLKTLIDLVSESNVSELEITEAEGKVRIVKGGSAAFQAPMQAPVAPVMPVAAVLPAAAAPQPVPEVSAPVGHVVKSPMVGTFEIESDKTGTITQILGENGQAVEYGQPLFVIE